MYQHMKMGFVDTELYNEYGARSTYKAGERTYTYNMQNNEFTIHNPAASQVWQYQTACMLDFMQKIWTPRSLAKWTLR